MNNLWNDEEAAHFKTDLALRAYTSRLLGGEKALVMYGGGNTSIKLRENNQNILYIKGSGADLAHVTEKDFPPVRLAAVLPLIELDTLSNADMGDQLRAALINPQAPRPSIETILHAILPFQWVEHTHADSVLAVANTLHGKRHIREAYGDTVVIVPYHHSGFELAKACHDVFSREATKNTIGMVLMNHGIFAFGSSARESYERMIALVTRAEDYLDSHGAWNIPLRFTATAHDSMKNHPLPNPPPQAGEGADVRSPGSSPWLNSPEAEPHAQQNNQLEKKLTPSLPLAGESWREGDLLAFATLRRDISQTAGFPLLLQLSSDPASLTYARRPDLNSLSQRGPATPQHAVFTKRVPMLGRDVAVFSAAYSHYLAENTPEQTERLPDTAPRIVLDPELGVIAAGVTAFYADAATEIYRHSMEIQSRAEALETYASLSPGEVLAAEIEYGGFELAMRNKYELAGQVALVDQALARQAEISELLAKGAAVIGLDCELIVKTLHSLPEYLGLRYSSDNSSEIEGLLEQAVRRYGGIDLLITDNPLLARACEPLLALSPVRKIA